MLVAIVILFLILLRGNIYRADIKRIGLPAARKRLRSSVLIMLTIYLGILGLLLGFEKNLVYHPYSAGQYWSPPPRLVFEDVTLKSSTGDSIHAWWCPQKEAVFTILFNHGNAGNLSNHAWIIESIRKEVNCNVLIYDYPGFGKSTGSPSEAGCYASADAAYTWLTETKKIPPDKIILMGQSLGCAMACELSVKKDHRAMILLSPFTTIRDRGQEMMPIFPVKWLMSHLYDNKSKLAHYQKSLLIGHSDADEVIPLHHGQQLYEAAGTKDKTFYQINGESHNAHPPGFFRAMKEFLGKL
ncbi:MAG: alpha/beta hydrolase [Gemmatales bacterium]